MNLDEQYEILAKRAHLLGERKKAAEQLVSWEKNVKNVLDEIAAFDAKVAELEGRLKAGRLG